MKNKKFEFRFRFKHKESDRWIPSAWSTYNEKEAEEMAEKHKADPLGQVYCYDLSCAI